MSLSLSLSLCFFILLLISCLPSVIFCLLQVRGGGVGGAKDPPAPGEEAQPGQRRPHRGQEIRREQAQF